MVMPPLRKEGGQTQQDHQRIGANFAHVFNRAANKTGASSEKIPIRPTGPSMLQAASSLENPLNAIAATDDAPIRI
jgi:hypothetical protein